jgi:hypothetical protein
MSAIHIPPALDRHLVSATYAAATTGDYALGAFEAVVEQVVRALRQQGAGRPEIERALGDVFAALAFPHAHTSFGGRYETLAARALSIVATSATRATLH